MTPPALDEEKYAAFCAETYRVVRSRTLETTRTYAAAVMQTGAELKIPVLDCFDGMMKNDRWKLYLSDGLHLTSDGYAWVFENIVKCIDEHFPAFGAKTLPLDAPLWRELNPKQLAETWANAESKPEEY